MGALTGKVAVVAGATRGAGRGIARGLGEAGATVYCTGRSTKGQPSPYQRPETIEETAEMVTAIGGTGIAVRVDHAQEAEVEALFQRVEAEQGRLDVLVNSIAGEDPLLGGWTSLWETDLGQGAEALRNTILTHVITAKHAALLMMKQGGGLIVEVTEHDLLGGGGNVLGDLAKSAHKSLTMRFAFELAAHRIAAIAITPGFLRSERVLEHFGVTEETWREGGKEDVHFLQSETPLFVGRAVAALAADPNVIARSGWLTSSWEVAREFDLTDEDGRRPDWGRHWPSVLRSMDWVEKGIRRQVEWLEGMAARGRGYLDQARAGGSTQDDGGSGPS